MKVHYSLCENNFVELLLVTDCMFTCKNEKKFIDISSFFGVKLRINKC